MNLLNLNHLRFSTKLPLIIATSALLTGGIVGYGAIATLTERANQAAEAQFESATQARAAKLKQYLESIVGNVHALTDNPTTFDAMQAFRREWAALGAGQTEHLQQAYIHANPNPLGKKNEMMAATDGSGYSGVHAKYHPWLNEFLTEMGLYDIFFIAPSGDVVYTVYKELDFASNVRSGSTALGSLFNRAMELPAGSEEVIYEDFKPYAPSNNVPAAFIGRPVFGDDGEKLGVLAFQMPIGKINDIMKAEDGLGATGEIGLYGVDFLMRNDSRFDKQSTILVRSNETEQVKLALEGKTGTLAHADNFAARDVLASYQPLEFEGVRYALIGEIDRAEVDAPVTEARNELLMQIAAIIAVIAALGLLVARSISKRIGRIGGVMGAIIQGDFPEVPYTADGDELGEMARSLNSVKGKMQENTRMVLALNSASSNVMMADENFNIVYMNQAVTGFLKEAEEDIRKDLPRFSVSGLIGANIDVFHKNPAHQRGMLAQLSSTYKTSIQVGGRSFDLVANPIFGKNGERLGACVEWLDGAAAGIVNSINKSQAVIEFRPDGTILQASENFLNAMGYTLEEIKGRHHSIFVDAAYKASADYQKFWEALNRGEAQTAEFKRFGKGGKEIWIQATYSPIADLKGRIVRVVKCATDITPMVMTRTENEQGMNEAVMVLTQISQGDLSRKMEGDYQGTFADIKRAVNATVEKLVEIVGRIRESAEAVSSASDEIASGSTDLSQRTEEQASSLEETAASMEEITGTVRQNSENARSANQLAAEARDVAENGGKVVSDAVTAMGSIEKSSQKISDIIGVIDEIAFQTNLLALNAAVEAARAGEAGKGFAVVASEVRTLAGRSASASKEIKALISESSQQVKTGAELVNRAGSTLTEIVSSVKRVADIIGDIAAASAEQSTGIDEVNSAITQMDEVTQQNAALVEENTAAAQSLVQQAGALDQMMRFFKIGEEEAMAEKPAVVKPVLVSPKPVVKKPAAKPLAKKAATGSAGKYDQNWEEF